MQLTPEQAHHVEYGYAIESTQRLTLDRVILSGEAGQITSQRAALSQLPAKLHELTVDTSGEYEAASPELAVLKDFALPAVIEISTPKTEVEAFLDRQIAAHPSLVQIENGWRNPKEQRPQAVQRGHIREIGAMTDNPDAEPVKPCSAAKTAIVVYGKQLGRKLTVCTDKNCPVHDPQAAAEAAANPAPTIAPAPEAETEEEAAEREAEHEQRMAEYKAEQERKEEEREAAFERQQKEYEAEQARRDKQRKARVATFERIIEEAPASFSPAQLRVFLRLLIHLDYSFLEEVATHYANGDENTHKSDDEIVLAALDGTADEKLPESPRRRDALKKFHWGTLHAGKRCRDSLRRRHRDTSQDGARSRGPFSDVLP